MDDEIRAYENAENQLRTQLPKVFSLGEFKSEDAAQMVVI
jgi:hypothetical protein